METGYYTPDIGDLFVGYECEIFRQFFEEGVLVGEGWEKIHMHSLILSSIQKDENFLTKIKTPYLTREQIEAEGWKYCRQFGDILEFIKDDHLSLRFDLAIRKISIGEDLYYGYCPSINEFRKLCKWLSIGNSVNSHNGK